MKKMKNFFATTTIEIYSISNLAVCFSFLTSKEKERISFAVSNATYYIRI